MSQASLHHQAQRILEWDQLLLALATQAQSSAGAEYCQQLPLVTQLEDAVVGQQETTEMRTVLESSMPFPTLVFEDLRETFERASKGAQLEGLELFHISVLLGLGDDVANIFDAFQEACPTVHLLAQELEPLGWVKDALVQCVDHEGNIRESATPELHQLIHHLHQLRQRIRQRLERMLASHEHEDLLQGQYFAERENRYVIPVKAEAQHQFPGIVHDISGSGATVFIEPRDLIELNNAIKIADLQVKKEIRRILQDLSSMVSTHVSTLSKDFETLVRLDCLGAKARLSMKMSANPVVLNARQHISLQQARHPLLILSKEHVIANDIHLTEDTHIYIISGPNTGGKTVTLKLLGLFALMVRAGLHLPCLESSEMCIFQRIYADIGDAQDLHRDLSSFSAHIVNMIELLKDTPKHAKGHFPASLVLLDEIGNATDPLEGAAIAEALLCRLHDLGYKVVVTTHYPSLKTLPLRKSGFINASHEFDVSTLAPTYRLLEGLPGGSSALEIAGRLGLDPSILTHASELVQGQERDLEAVFQQLQDTQWKLDRELTQARAVRLEADQFHQEARDTKDRLRQSERQERQKIRKDLQAEFSRVKRMINESIDSFKKDPTLIKAKSAHQNLSALQQESQALLANKESIPIHLAAVGDVVEIKNLGTIGILLEPTEGKTRVNIRIGEKVISVDAELLQGVCHTQSSERGPTSSRTTSTRSKKQTVIPQTDPYPHKSQIVTPSFKVDLRGKAVDEAMEATEAAFDHAMMQGLPSVLVIHGHGTGKLKASLRTFFSESPYVTTFRPGDRSEGGDGVTVVELR